MAASYGSRARAQHTRGRSVAQTGVRDLGVTHPSKQNTIQTSVNGAQSILYSPDRTSARDHRFVGTYHWISAAGGHINLPDNNRSAPLLSGVPGIGYPSFAIGFEAVPRASGK